MKNFVLDASTTLAWCFSDEATSKSVSILEQLETSIAFVPALWSLEVGNVLTAAERRKRITYSQIAEFIALLEGLSIQYDHETAARGFHEIIALSHSEKLTTYDAAYLELAMRLGLPLASKDTELCEAAARLGVVVY